MYMVSSTQSSLAAYLAKVNKKSDKRFKYFSASGSTSSWSTSGSTLRSARRHTALATCRFEEVAEKINT